MNHKSIIKFTKKFFFIISFIFAIIITILSSLNIIKYPLYKDYYSNLTKLCKNPGLNEDYIPQGITFFDNKIITVGYMKNQTNSRIYVIDSKTNEEKHFKLISNGKDFLGHTGGIQYLNGFLYLADEGTGIYKIPINSLNKNSSTTIDIGTPTKGK